MSRPTLAQFQTVAHARTWVDERFRVWNLMQPLENNRGWQFLAAKAKTEAKELSRDLRELDLSDPNIDRTLIKLHVQWADKTELATPLDDARTANQEALELLQEIESWEKEHGHA